MSNRLDADQARYFVGHVLGPNCLQKLSADDTRRQQGFSLASAIGHSPKIPKIVPDVPKFAVQLGKFVRDDSRKCTLFGNAQ